MKLNPDTCFSVPVKSVELSEHPVDMETLLSTLKTLIPEHINAIRTQFLRQFPSDEALNEAKTDTLKKLQTLLLVLQNPETSHDKKIEIAITIHERIGQCFGGFFNGINALIDKLHTPEDFSDYLYYIRRDFIEGIARLHTTDVHGVNHFLIVAHSEVLSLQGQEVRGFGIKPMDSHDKYSGGLKRGEVLSAIHVGLQSFNVPMVINELVSRIKQDILARLVKNERNCIIPEALDIFFQKFFANHPIVRAYLQVEKTNPPTEAQISAYEAYQAAFYSLDDNVLPMDLNWSSIQRMLVEEMQRQNLFVLSESETAILDFLYNLSSTVKDIQINSYEDVKYYFSFQGIVKGTWLKEKAKPFIREKIAQSDITQYELKFLLGLLKDYPDLVSEYRHAFVIKIASTRSLEELITLLRALKEHPEIDVGIALRRRILNKIIRSGQFSSNDILEVYKALPEVLQQELVDYWSADNLYTPTRLFTGFFTQIYLLGIIEIGADYRLDFLSKVNCFMGQGIDLLNGLKPAHQEQMLRYIAHDIRFFFGYYFHRYDFFIPEKFLSFFKSIPNGIKEMVLYDFIQNDILRKYVTLGRPRNLLGKFFESDYVDHEMMIDFYAALPPDLLHRVLHDCHQHHKRRSISLKNLHKLLSLFDNEADRTLVLESILEKPLFATPYHKVHSVQGEQGYLKDILGILNDEQKERFLFLNRQNLSSWIGTDEALFIELVQTLPFALRHYVIMLEHSFPTTAVIEEFAEQWIQNHNINLPEGINKAEYVTLYFKLNLFKVSKQEEGRIGSAQTFFDCFTHRRQMDAASQLMEKMLHPEMELSPDVIAVCSQGPLAEFYQQLNQQQVVRLSA